MKISMFKCCPIRVVQVQNRSKLTKLVVSSFSELKVKTTKISWFNIDPSQVNSQSSFFVNHTNARSWRSRQLNEGSRLSYFLCRDCGSCYVCSLKSLNIRDFLNLWNSSLGLGVLEEKQRIVSTVTNFLCHHGNKL